MLIRHTFFFLSYIFNKSVNGGKKNVAKKLARPCNVSHTGKLFIIYI
ncbi:hypothetical protein BCAH1134_4179 [Bacillus cereus AH1134]|nr:hypothetical protein BMB171_C3759 [Bacillus thuringiensis BMB171]EDZ51071.1 hypothetical protein BCAH1134_4179 [Bacillus cereus AH1134]QDD85417.1 hypothetical protein FORC087_4126 [Bacillus cereus]